MPNIFSLTIYLTICNNYKIEYIASEHDPCIDYYWMGTLVLKPS